MKSIFENIPLVKNEAEKRFEIEVDGKYAFIKYGEYGNQTALVHTETESELEGTGAASALIEKTLNYLENQNLKLLPFCPLVFVYINGHLEWKRIVSNLFKGYGEI